MSADKKNSSPPEAPSVLVPPQNSYEDRVLQHAYDGIQEYDNPLPGWWVRIFWITIIFAGLYFFYFQISGKGKSIRDDYAADVAQFDAKQAKLALKETVSEESIAKLLANSGAVAGGQKVFLATCRPCHADQGQGLIGPNLTDDHWIHGRGHLMDIYKTVDQGVPAKGMPAWGRQLSPAELRQVVAFVGTLRGKRVAGKAPEGVRVTEADAEGAAPATGSEAGIAVDGGAAASRAAP